MGNYINLSIIIPTYNREKDLIETINSILRGKSIPKEIIIIDQSNDFKINELKVRRLIDNTEIELNYISQESPSLTMARNNGFRVATHNILVFSDDDVEYRDDTLSNIYDLMLNENITLVGGLDSGAPRSKSLFAFLFCTRSYLKKNYGHISYGVYGRYPNIDRVNKTTYTEWAMGYLFAVKKDKMKKWDLSFNEVLNQYAYGEDLEFSARYCKKSLDDGYKTILSPKVVVNHKCSRTWRISTNIQNYMLVVNRYYIMKKLFKNNIIYEIGFRWSNIGTLIKKIIKRDNARTFWNAIRYCEKNKEKIKNGDLGLENIN